MVNAPLRVLVVFGKDGPSATVRGEVYRSKLVAPRFAGDFVPLYWSWLTRLRERAAGHARHAIRPMLTAPIDVAVVGLRHARTRQLLSIANRYDRIMLIKYFDSAFVAALRRASRARILYDMDDAVWLPEFLGPEEAARIVASVDRVSCDNAYLQEFALRHNPRAFVLRGPVKLLPVRSRTNTSRPVVGWLGSPSTLHYLDRLREPLRRLGLAIPGGFEFRVIGGGHDRSRWPAALPGVTMSVIPTYDQDDMHRQLGELDVGVFPLNDDDNSRGRGILKATLYMSAGVPSICSAIGELPSFIDHGVDGFVCDTDDAWFESLSTAIRSAEVRARVGAAGRALIASQFSLDGCFERLDREFLR